MRKQRKTLKMREQRKTLKMSEQRKALKMKEQRKTLPQVSKKSSSKVVLPAKMPQLSSSGLLYCHNVIHQKNIECFNVGMKFESFFFYICFFF